jgi:hypothetical protein
MDFSMPACSRREFLRAAGALIALAAVTHPVHARDGKAAGGGINLEQAEISRKGELFQLSGNFNVQLSATLENALLRGVQLTFIQEFEAERLRDFWLSEDLIELERSIRLSYNALLRQYYVSLSGTSSTHDSLESALRAVGDLRDWAVLNIKQMKRKSDFKAYLRMYLDVAQLPKPLQVNALASSARWQLDSGWQERSFKY